MTGTGWHWELAADQCVGCGICADVCGSAAITMTRDAALPVPVPGACVGCGDCVRECPTGAIAVREERAAAVPPAPPA